MKHIDWHAVAAELRAQLARAGETVFLQECLIETQKAVIDKLKRENEQLKNELSAPWLIRNSPAAQRHLEQSTYAQERERP